MNFFFFIFWAERIFELKPYSGRDTKCKDGLQSYKISKKSIGQIIKLIRDYNFLTFLKFGFRA
jgi:hypothetical protein